MVNLTSSADELLTLDSPYLNPATTVSNCLLLLQSRSLVDSLDNINIHLLRVSCFIYLTESSTFTNPTQRATSREMKFYPKYSHITFKIRLKIREVENTKIRISSRCCCWNMLCSLLFMHLLISLHSAAMWNVHSAMTTSISTAFALSPRACA